MKVILNYFKPSGKWYSTATYEVANGMPLYAIWDHIRDSLEMGIRPGLVDCKSREHEFLTLVDVPEHERNHPHLIVPTYLAVMRKAE